MSAAGFSSRSAVSTFQQFPQRDGEHMSEMEPGFSNSKPTDDEAPKAEAKRVEASTVEDKAVKSPTAKSAARKKS